MCGWHSTQVLWTTNTVVRYSRVCMEPRKPRNVLGSPSHGFSLLNIITIPMITCTGTHTHTWCMPNSASVDIYPTHTRLATFHIDYSHVLTMQCVCVCVVCELAKAHSITYIVPMVYTCTGIAIRSQKERNSGSTTLHSTWWIRISTVHWVCTHLWHTLSKKMLCSLFPVFP